MSGRRPQANRTLDVLSAVWTRAARQKHVRWLHPAKGVEKYGESGRERYLSKNEFLRLSEALTAAETIGLPYSVDEFGPKAKHAPKPEKRLRKFDSHAIAAILLLILTELDCANCFTPNGSTSIFERGMVLLPDSKTGRKPIYLSAAAAAILSTLPRLDGNPYVFPGEKNGQPRADLKRPWMPYARPQASMGCASTTSSQLRFCWGRASLGTADHREATWPPAAVHNAALCPSGRGPNETRG